MKYLFIALAICLSYCGWGQNTPSFSIEERFLSSASTPVIVAIEGPEGVLGFQFAIEWDPAAITFDSVSGYGVPGLIDNSFNFDQTDQGILSVVWFDSGFIGHDFSNNEDVFSVFFSENTAVIDTNLISFSTATTPPVIVYWDENDVVESVPNTSSGALWMAQSLSAVITATTEVSCHNGSDGEIIITAAGGLEPYEFEVDEMTNSTGVFEGLTAGGYTVIITDAENTQTNLEVALSQPPPLFVVTNIIDLPCENMATGMVTSTVSGGAGSYEYLWSNGSTDINLQNVLAGEYSLTVTDENNCVANTTIQLINVTFVDSLFSSSPTCFGGNDGSASLSLNNEIVAINWSNGTTESSVTDLTAGEYDVQIVDVNGCSELYQFTLNDSPEIDANINLIYGCGDGNITAISNPQLGIAPYNITWSTLTTGNYQANLSSGNYSISITDANNCSSSSEFEVEYIAPLSIVADIQDVLCSGTSDGQIDLNVNGGTPPYSFNWSNDSTVEDIDGLAGGAYSVNVTAGNCAIFMTYELAEPLPITTQVLFTSAANNLIDAEVLVSGGTPEYIITWSNGASGSEVTNLQAGEEVTFFVTDGNDCNYEETVIPILTNWIDASVDFLPIIYPNPSRGLISLVWEDDYPKINNISLINTLGQFIPIEYQKENSLMQMTVNTPVKGNYWLRIETLEGVYLRLVTLY